LYGTQFTVTDGELGPCPIEDRQRLDERRAEAGLEPFDTPMLVKAFFRQEISSFVAC
jgi:hypothetical protein